MQKINYRLIVSDFDGTLVNDDGTICEENKRAIARYVEGGGSFAISTGRLHYGILDRARELNLKGLVACCQGALIVDIESGKPVQDHMIPHETTLAICRKMEELGVCYQVYDFENYYANNTSDGLRFYEKMVRKKAICITDKPLSAYVKEKKMGTYKVLAMVDPKDNERLYQEIDKTCFKGCALTKSAPYLIEVINAKSSKGTAVEFLANYYGVPLEKTIAVGDQWNDLPMIEKAGLGIAVQNADQKLKERAVVCSLTNEQGAIAEVIEKYGYTED